MAARIITPAVVNLAKEQQGQGDRLAKGVLKIEGLDDAELEGTSPETGNKTLRYVGIAGALGLAYFLLKR